MCGVLGVERGLFGGERVVDTLPQDVGVAARRDSVTCHRGEFIGELSELHATFLLVEDGAAQIVQFVTAHRFQAHVVSCPAALPGGLVGSGSLVFQVRSSRHESPVWCAQTPSPPAANMNAERVVATPACSPAARYPSQRAGRRNPDGTVKTVEPD